MIDIARVLLPALAFAATLGCARHAIDDRFDDRDAKIGEALTFGAWLAPLPPGTEVSWNFGDGETAVGAPVTHAFSRAGAFDVTLNIRSADSEESGKAKVAVRTRTPFEVLSTGFGLAFSLPVWRDAAPQIRAVVTLLGGHIPNFDALIGGGIFDPTFLQDATWIDSGLDPSGGFGAALDVGGTGGLVIAVAIDEPALEAMIARGETPDFLGKITDGLRLESTQAGGLLCLAAGDLAGCHIHHGYLIVTAAFGEQGQPSASLLSALEPTPEAQTIAADPRFRGHWATLARKPVLRGIVTRAAGGASGEIPSLARAVSDYALGAGNLADAMLLSVDVDDGGLSLDMRTLAMPGMEERLRATTSAHGEPRFGPRAIAGGGSDVLVGASVGIAELPRSMRKGMVRMREDPTQADSLAMFEKLFAALESAGIDLERDVVPALSGRMGGGLDIDPSQGAVALQGLAAGNPAAIGDLLATGMVFELRDAARFEDLMRKLMAYGATEGVTFRTEDPGVDGVRIYSLSNIPLGAVAVDPALGAAAFALTEAEARGRLARLRKDPGDLRAWDDVTGYAELRIRDIIADLQILAQDPGVPMQLKLGLIGALAVSGYVAWVDTINYAGRVQNGVTEARLRIDFVKAVVADEQNAEETTTN